MKVVFFEDVEGTARVGDVKEVKNGFARNFLLPRNIAGAHTKDNLMRANSLAQKESRRQERLDAEARSVTSKLENYTITIEARVGESGRLFGSVTNRDVAEHLNAAAGTTVDSHIVLLAEPIRELGARPVTIRFTRNVSVDINVDVVPDEASKPVVAKFLAEQEAQRAAEAKAAEARAYAAKQAADAAAAAGETEEETESE